MLTRTLLRLLLPLSAAVLLSSCSRHSESAPPPRSSSPSNQVSASTTTAKPQFEKLKGKWLRPDGDYVVHIKEVAPDGKLEVGYFNPGPINVSKAAAIEDHGETKVFIELRDEGYPGCTYSLTYDTKNDQLFGTYYQASMQQTFDVAFDRLKDQ